MQNHVTKHLDLFFVVVVVALSCKTTILLVIGVTFEHLINQTGVDHLSTFFVFLFFVLPATLQMQISLSKLSSVFRPECCEQCLHIFL